MMRIPFNRCVVLTTLNFAQITDRLASAIYFGADPLDRHSQLLIFDRDCRASTTQHYVGQLQGFKFIAARIIGPKFFNLHKFFSPTIEGQIDSLYHGYQISLIVKIQNATLVLLLACLGGLFAAISSVLDNILGESKNYQYVNTVAILIACYLLLVAYLYFDACRTIDFFKTLFAQRLLAPSSSLVVYRGSSKIQLFDNIQQDNGSYSKSTTDILRKNLPSFPTVSKDLPAENIAATEISTTELLQKNLPSIPTRANQVRSRQQN